ncbi:MAG TPA: hypothetical protein VGB91_13950 [Rhizomicrobium sp.]
MTTLTSKQMLTAIDTALEESSRWPRLLQMFGCDMSVGRPGPLWLNDALVERGFQRVVDERDSVRTMRPNSDYPDAWWLAIAQEVTGRRDATVQQVVDALHARDTQHAAQ